MKHGLFEKGVPRLNHSPPFLLPSDHHRLQISRFNPLNVHQLEPTVSQTLSVSLLQDSLGETRVNKSSIVPETRAASLLLDRNSIQSHKPS